METKPCALVLSNTNIKPQSLIKLISKSDSVDEDKSATVKCNWLIDSKYYTAEICLMGIKEDFQRSEDFNNRVEALILHVDTNKLSGLKELDRWDKIDQDCDPDIKLLVANYCNNDTKVTKAKATEWCLKKGYELIELYPTSNEEDNTASDFDEKVGAERIIEALQSHMWSNLVLKSQTKKETSHKSGIDSSNSKDIIDEDLDDNLEEFTELFSQLHSIRESLNCLQPRDRKKCAEHMVTAFWKAIGGDEEELSDT